MTLFFCVTSTHFQCKSVLICLSAILCPPSTFCHIESTSLLKHLCSENCQLAGIAAEPAEAAPAQSAATAALVNTPARPSRRSTITWRRPHQHKRNAKWRTDVHLLQCLEQFVAIPTVSGDPALQEACFRGAKYIAGLLEGVGMQVCTSFSTLSAAALSLLQHSLCRCVALSALSLLEGVGMQVYTVVPVMFGKPLLNNLLAFDHVLLQK